MECGVVWGNTLRVYEHVGREIFVLVLLELAAINCHSASSVDMHMVEASGSCSREQAREHVAHISSRTSSSRSIALLSYIYSPVGIVYQFMPMSTWCKYEVSGRSVRDLSVERMVF